jgi:hypothetical protein
MNSSSLPARIFFWLSGASEESLRECPAWERRKYVAFGATVLVPSLFALISSAYAISTLTDNWAYIIPVSLVWAFIILTVDRALLATYRAYQSFFRKISQFSLRIVVAALMGLTISHPLALLLFRDTVSSVIEKHREVDIAAAHTESAALKQQTEDKITALDGEITALGARWDETFRAEFLAVDPATGERPLTADEQAAKAELEQKIAEASAPLREKVATVEKEIAVQDAESKKLQSELDFWQKEFERELNGQRSGIVGLGPRAKSIQTDQLTWRREESKRLSAVVESLTFQRNQMQEELVALEQRLAADAAMAAAEHTAKLKAEEARVMALKQQVQQQQADTFVDQQNQLRATLKEQMDALRNQANVMRQELAQLAADEQTRVAAIRAEPRRDILTQTLALHELFEQDAQGGNFALAAYLVLTLLFMLVDTIPLVVKFFSKPGPYDSLLDLDEVRFEKERETYLKSFRRYMDDLANGRLLHLTRNKPLELALIEGVDRSRAAKEFLESLMGLEKVFEERVRMERELLAKEGQSLSGERAAMIEEMASAFYADLRQRMELFFSHGAARRIATSSPSH